MATGVVAHVVNAVAEPDHLSHGGLLRVEARPGGEQEAPAEVLARVGEVRGPKARVDEAEPVSGLGEAGLGQTLIREVRGRLNLQRRSHNGPRWTSGRACNIAERNFGDLLFHQFRQLQLLRRKCLRDGQASHPGGFRGLHAIHRVFDDDAAFRRQSQSSRRDEKNVRRRLFANHVFSGDDGIPHLRRQADLF